MLEVLAEDYVGTARAKGLNSRPGLIGHAPRNALIPVLTLLRPPFSLLLGRPRCQGAERA